MWYGSGVTTSPSTMRLRVSVGETIAGKYVVEAVLGEGGMGVVVRARHAALGSRVAIKFMHLELASDQEMRARFRAEAERVAQMQSEHIAMVLDVGELPNGVPYIVMEYVEGRDLASILQERGPLPVWEAVDYLLQACEGIAEAHSRGIVHRDIKPANLLVAKLRDGSTVVKVLDFGIAKALPTGTNDGGKLTHANAIMGSPYYSAPEQLESAALADQRSDIWALGVTLHELLTGQGPFDGTSQATIMASIMTLPPIPLRQHRPELPEDLEQIVAQCLEKDPDRRFARVVDFVERLARHGSREATGSFARITGIPGQERRNSEQAPAMVVPPTAPPARRGLSRRGVILATVGSVLILGALIATYVLFGASVEPPVLPPPLPLPPEAPTVRRLVMPRDVPVVRPVR
jgi:serine/threonine-protein kinase